MDITDDAKIQRIYEASLNKTKWRKDVRACLSTGEILIKHIFSDWNIKVLHTVKEKNEKGKTIKVPKVYKIKHGDQVFVLKKIKPIDHDDLLIDNVCEIMANAILTCSQKDIVVPMRNAVMTKDRLYMIFDYHASGTIWSKKDELRSNSKLAFATMKAVCERLQRLHTVNELLHFDAKVDNIFIDINYAWVDTQMATSTDHENAGNEPVIDIKFGDFGLCELTIQGKRFENDQIPRAKVYLKKWGVFPKHQAVSYDYLTVINSIADFVGDSEIHPFVGDIWDELEKMLPDFSRTMFDNENCRIQNVYNFEYDDVLRVLESVQRKYNF